MRVVAIVYGLFTLTSVDEDTAQWHGLAMTVLAKAFTILRIFSPVLQDEDVVVTMVSYGAHRILPMLAAVFGGVRASIFFTLWAVVETVAAGVYKRVITSRSFTSSCRRPSPPRSSTAAGWPSRSWPTPSRPASGSSPT